jgi:hypothetical protein
MRTASSAGIELTIFAWATKQAARHHRCADEKNEECLYYFGPGMDTLLAPLGMHPLRLLESTREDGL